MEKSKKDKASEVVRIPTLKEYNQTLSEQERRLNLIEVKSTLKTLKKYGY